MILPSDLSVGFMLAVAAALAYSLLAAASASLGMRAIRGLLLTAWTLHGLTLFSGLFGDTPRFGFAAAMSVTGWLALTIYAVESRLFPDMRPRRILAVLGALAVILTLLFPGTPLHPKASVWLPVHLALGVASYGLFAAAVFHAWLMRRAEKQMRKAAGPDGSIPLLTLERLTFQFVQAGFVLLSATLLFGWAFGESLYGPGRAWKWDHKTIFSVLSWCVFAALLIGRSRFGWRGRRAVRVLYMGSGLLLLGYAGSRFVLEVILGRAV